MNENNFTTIQYLNNHININFNFKFKKEYINKLKDLGLNTFIFNVYKIFDFLLIKKDKKLKIKEKNNLLKFIFTDNSKNDVYLLFQKSFLKKNISLNYINIDVFNNINISNITEIKIYFYLNTDINDNNTQINLIDEFNIFEEIFNKIFNFSVKSIKSFFDYYKNFIYNINDFILNYCSDDDV